MNSAVVINGAMSYGQKLKQKHKYRQIVTVRAQIALLQRQ